MQVARGTAMSVMDLQDHARNAGHLAWLWYHYMSAFASPGSGMLVTGKQSTLHWLAVEDGGMYEGCW